MKLILESVQKFAKANILGSTKYPNIVGEVIFRQLDNEVRIKVDLKNLPESSFLGFHIHKNGDCSGNDKDEFKNVGKHYNPSRASHPEHAGDLPLLYTSDGKISTTFETDKFTVDEIIGKAIIIHSQRDDFKSQPAGDSGEKIACGVIKGDEYEA